jgi:hypothetical protein
MRLHRFAVLALLGVFATSVSPANGRAAEPQKPSATPSAAKEVERGRTETIFEISSPGRFSVRAESSIGAALQIIDRMAGPSTIAGEIGKSDGRLDRLLDRGAYKAVLLTPPTSDAQATLHVEPFRELSGANPPRLVELKPLSTDLIDLTQRSWWLDVTSRRPVAIEAAGRYLADLRLWKDGNWLADAEPTSARVEPEPGRPLAVRRLAVTLEPGLYLLTAYGGPGEPWAQASDARPLYLRFGIPSLAEAGRAAQIASPFGIDRFLVPGRANRFLLQLPQAASAALTVGAYNPSSPFASGGIRETIDQKSRTPAAGVSTPSGNSEFSLVTVDRQPGQPYRLLNFFASPSYTFGGSGDYWLEVVHTPTTDDDPDLTSVLTEADGKDEHIVAYRAIEIGADKSWKRRFNLIARTTLHVAVTEGGNYRVDATGENIDAEFRFEPVGPRPEGYRVPAFERGDHPWALEAGIYLLTIEPRAEKKGIATLTIKPAEATGDIASAARQGTVAYRHQQLVQTRFYHLYSNTIPGVSSGLVLRKLPIDLAQDLPITVEPGEHIDLPLMISGNEAGTISAVTDDGTARPIALDGQNPVAAAPAPPGQHRVIIDNRDTHDLSLRIQFTPNSLQASSPLPTLSADRLQGIPRFPLLSPTQPAYLDIAAREQRTFNITVPEPGLYRIETSGLLHTAGNLRARMVTSLQHADANGVGRNFLLQRYLREGDYQVSFGTVGDSAGHLGLALSAAPLGDGGTLIPGIASHTTLSPGQAIRYDFTIERKAQYRLQVFGLNRQFDLRLEDADGWPVAAPIVTGMIEHEFLPGRYHAIVLPGDVAGGVIALLEEILPTPEYKGHGPHTIAVDETVSHEWLEPETGGERVPDQWRFHLPAGAHIHIDIGEGMLASLVREQAGRDIPVGDLLRNPGWSGKLDGGDYRIDARAIGPNNHLSYEIAVRSEELLAGQRRAIKAPASLLLSLGGNDLVELSSFGNASVRGRLYDEAGTLVATGDDQVAGWNFHIAATLQPGRYRVLVEPVGATKADTRIDMVVPIEQQEGAIAVPSTMTVQDADLHSYPLQPPAKAGLLVIAARSRGTVTLALDERAESDVWRTLQSATGTTPVIALPITAATESRYRARIWSTDHRKIDASMQTAFVTPAPASEADLARGITLTPIEGVNPAIGIAAIAPARPGVFQLAEDSPSLRWTSQISVPATGNSSQPIIAGSDLIWLIDRGEQAPKARAARVDFHQAVALALPSGPAQIAVTSESGLTLWLAQTRFGQPGVVVGDMNNANVLMGTAKNSAVSVMSPTTDKALLHLWNAGDSTAPLQTTVRQIAFSKTPQRRLSQTESDIKLSAESANALELPPGNKRLRLVLPPETVALLRQGDAALATLWTDRDSKAFVTEFPVDGILLLHAGQSDASAAVSWSLTDASQLTLSTDTPLKRFANAAEILVLPLQTEKATGLHVAGNGVDTVLVTADGRVMRGNDITAARSGLLFVQHEPGLVAAWLDSNARADVPGLAVEAPAQAIKLSGDHLRLVLMRTAPTLLTLRTDIPVIAQATAPDGRSVTELFAAGADLHRYLPIGRSVVDLQSAGLNDLAGNAEILLRSVTPMDEGLGEAARLGGGDSRVYGFTLAEETTVGVGVRASNTVVRSRLLDGAGLTLGSGIVQMHRLAAGTYTLLVELPPGAEPTEVQPALVGVRRPDTGPPDEVKRQYLRLVGKSSLE